jgi:hypothetical protein
MTSLILHPTAKTSTFSRSRRAADRRSAALAIVWLGLAAAVPLGALFVASSPQVPAVSGSDRVAPYIEAKVGRL